MIDRWNIERKLRTLHGWLGALILPWIVLAGLTGYYMNHKDAVLRLLPEASVPGPEVFAGLPESAPVATSGEAMVIAAHYRPEASLKLDRDSTYSGRRVWTIDTGDDAVIVDRETGYVWVRERYRVTAYAANGSKVGTEWRWSKILTSLHTRGWVGSALGRWLADFTALSLVVFGLSGIVLFWAPRLRKRKNRRARLKAVQS